LLGIPLFESNPDVISQAAARQMFHVQTFQAGPYAEACQQVLGQLAYAQASLLNPQQKAFYDQQLAEALGHRTERQVAAPPPPPGSFNPAGGQPAAMPGAFGSLPPAGMAAPGAYGSPPVSPVPGTMAAPGAFGSPPPVPMAAPGAYGSPPTAPLPATMAAPGAYADAGGYAGANAAWGQATQYPLPPAPAPGFHGPGLMGSTVPTAMSASVPLATPVAVPVAAAVAAPPAVAQPRPGSPPVVGGKGPLPPPPPVQDEESALASVIQDERVPRGSLRRRLSAKQPKGLSREMISLCVAGAVIALIALVWLMAHAMDRQKHGWDTYIEPTAASPSKKKAGAERADKTVRDAGKKREEGQFAVRPRPGVARPPWAAPAVGPRPARPPAAAEDQGEAIAAPVTKSFPPATHNPLGDFGPGAQLPPGTEPAQPAPAPEANNLPPLPEEAVDAPPDREIGPRN